MPDLTTIADCSFGFDAAAGLVSRSTVSLSSRTIVDCEKNTFQRLMSELMAPPLRVSHALNTRHKGAHPHLKHAT